MIVAATSEEVDCGRMTSTEPINITLDRPSELIASIPALLGFHPVDSLVVLGQRGLRAKELRLVLRADLPPPHEAGDLVDNLLLPLLQHGSAGVTMVVVGGQDSSPDDDLPHRELMARCEAAFAQDGLPVVHQFWTPDIRADVRWHCYDEPDCTGVLPEPDSTELATVASQLGLSVYGSRDDIVAMLEPDPPDVLARRWALLDRHSEMANVIGDPPDGLATVLSAIEAAAATPPDLADEDVVVLVKALSNRHVRDYCLDLDNVPDIVAAERLWAALTRATPPPERAEPASLLAFSAYSRGDGVLAGIALANAEEANPGHLLCHLLRAALTVALPPAKLREAGRRAAKGAEAHMAGKPLDEKEKGIDHDAMTELWPARLTVRPLTPDDARRVSEWRYDGPWSVYDPRPGDEPVTAEQGYWAVAGADGGPFVGYYCTGVEARVPGLEAEPGVLDLGVGMAPEWVGQGHGAQFAQAVVDHVRQHHGATRLRATVQSWNTRSLKLTHHLGFTEQRRHTCTQNGKQVEYTVLTTD